MCETVIEILLVPLKVIGGVVGIGDLLTVTVWDTVIEILLVPLKVIGGVVGILVLDNVVDMDGVWLMLLVPLKVIGGVVGILVLDNVVDMDGVWLILLLPLNVIGGVVGIAELDIVFWLEELDDILNDILDELELIILFVAFGLLVFKYIPNGGSYDLVIELVKDIVLDNDW